jgi:hypothetical protein
MMPGRLIYQNIFDALGPNARGNPVRSTPLAGPVPGQPQGLDT